MASAYNKFHKWTTNIGKSVNLGTDLLGVMLTNVLPLATYAVYADISASEIAAGFGYVTGGPDVTIVSYGDTDIAGVAELVTTRPSISAVGGAIGPYRYAVLYDKTTGHLTSWYDYGASVTIQDGETVEVQFDDGTGNGTFRIGA